MKKYFLSLIVIVFACITTASAQYNFSKVDNWLEENTPDMGGRSVLMIYKDGKIVYTKSVNELTRRQKMVGKIIARRQGKAATTEDFTATTQQMIASCSKWYSAALVMTFVDEGKLKLTDTVGKYLSILSKHDKGNITIAQCLSHTTGIKATDLKESLQDWKSVGSMDEAIAQIAVLPMEGKPGTVFHYSNAGLQIAGAVIEKISGKSFEAMFAERIATPLSMKNTDFGKGKVALPAGGGRSTAEDYINFLIMILNKGTFSGKRILSEGSAEQMQINRITPEVNVAYSPAEAGGLGYGFGEWIVEKSTTTGLTTAVSSPGLFGSFPWVDNERKYAAFLLTFYIKNNGRQERYKKLRTLVNEVLR